MAGVEALGAAAATFQLAECAIKVASALYEVYRQRPPDTVRYYLDQISILTGTTAAIEDHPYLQTPDVARHLESTLTKAQSLQRTLGRLHHHYSGRSTLRYWTVLLSLREEKEIIRKLDDLEKEKSGLILSVTIAQTSIIGRLDSNVQDLVDRSGNMGMATPQDAPTDSGARRAPGATVAKQEGDQRSVSSMSHSKHQFITPVAAGKANNQFNGDSGTNTPAGRNQYDSPRTDGTDNTQINGNTGTDVVESIMKHKAANLVSQVQVSRDSNKKG